MSEIESFLSKKGYIFKLVTDNYQLNCPLCTDNKNRLGIHKDTGKWHCFNCDAASKKNTIEHNLKNLDYAIRQHTGNTDISFIKKSIDERKQEKKIKIPKNIATKFHMAILKKDNNAKRALWYLKKKRGFSLRTIKHFKLGIRTTWEKNGESYETEPYISIPFFEGSVLTNLKYRLVKVTKKNRKLKWKRETGGKSSLFNDSILDDYSYDEIIIGESEIDSMSLYNEGMHNVVGLTVGAKSFKQEWRDRLARFKKIYIVLDNDEAGQAGARKLAGNLGMGRCYNVVLPDTVKDINEFFWDDKNKCRNNTLDNFKALLSKAKRFTVDGVINSKDMSRIVLDNILSGDDDKNNGLLTPWSNLNKLMGGARPGHFIVVAAKSKVGKTTLCVNWMLYLANNKHSSLYYSCEMNPDSMGRNLIRMTDYEYTSMDTITPLMAKRAAITLPYQYLNFVYPKLDDFDLDKIIEKMKNSIFRYGVKIIFFDNLLFLTRGIETGKERDIVGTVTQRFKSFAETNGIVFVLITHPKKTNHNRRLRPDDMKDSSAIFQDLDTLIMPHRALKDEDSDLDEDDMASSGAMENEMQVSVYSRYSEGGDTYMYFNGHRGLITDDSNAYDEMMLKKRKEFKKKNRKK